MSRERYYHAIELDDLFSLAGDDTLSITFAIHPSGPTTVKNIRMTYEVNGPRPRLTTAVPRTDHTKTTHRCNCTEHGT